MTIHNRLDKTFGPVGSMAGIILFIAGLVLSYFYLSGVLLILLGAFVGFSSTSAIIDPEKKRIMFSNNLFGIIPTGSWIDIEPSMTIGIKEFHQTYRAFSQGNRPLDIDQNDYRIVLYDQAKKEIMQLKRTGSIDSAKEECKALGDLLGLRIV
jgi:hypothetical protein